MLNNKNTIPIIFARSGSKGIKNKNLKKFAGKELIYYSIKYFNLLGFKDFFVSSDSKKILKYAQRFGGYPILRPKFLATDKSNELLSWKHAINLLNKTNNFKYIFSLPCTSPLRSILTLKKALNLMKNKNPDMVVSITSSNKSPDFNMLTKDNVSGRLKIYNKKKNIFRRQDANKVFTLNTNFYIANVNYILKTKNLLGGRILGIETPKFESIDIDDIYDFEIAELIYEKKFRR